MKLNRIFIVFAVVTSFLLSGVVWSKPGEEPEGPPTVDANVVNTPDVYVVEDALDRVTLWDRDCDECTSGSGCTWESVLADFSDDIPSGKWVIIETINITYENSGAGFLAESSASFQSSGPFQRWFVGEMIPTPGYTGADAMATANISVLLVDALTSVVSFPATPIPTSSYTCIDTFVSGRLIDAPLPPQ